MSAITPAHLADQAAEAIRNLNHATQSSKGELTYPSDAHEIVGPLNRLADRLPQSFDQISEFLDALAETSAVTADHGTAEDHIGEARSALASCALIAQTLAEHLERAHTALAPLGYDTAKEEPHTEA
ncbi:hypothetical protein OG302_14420 [Streptomyces sp. NBC_01283]|uniref:hypothetical protein n=1 Tax=Streptomyces sp. NBC_01283 TaxID=2903812 RepID=UPI00352D2214|nr:hypothetical protein OG302_14420 [Streptomyces sp. NBC_01283]